MTLRFSISSEMKHNWPKNSEGVNLDLKSVLDSILGAELNDELSSYYDGWEHGQDGWSAWFFTNLPEDLRNRIIGEFQKERTFILIELFILD